jgi:hypothetical protein
VVPREIAAVMAAARMDAPEGLEPGRWRADNSQGMARREGRALSYGQAPLAEFDARLATRGEVWL